MITKILLEEYVAQSELAEESYVIINQHNRNFRKLNLTGFKGLMRLH